MHKSSARLALATLTLFAAGVTNAASVSYFLDQSNVNPLLPDGVNDYLKVTISDATYLTDVAAIRFDVTVLSPLTSLAVSNFGIQNFAFNTTNPMPANVIAAVTGLPTGWSVGTGNADGFGSYELTPNGNGGSRQNPTLTFYISGISGDVLTDYTTNNGGGFQGNYFFAAHVAGFSDVDPGAGLVTSAWFGGNAASIEVVPVPAAVWLFGSAFGVLALVRRKIAA